jgi:hypothetical protein
MVSSWGGPAAPSHASHAAPAPALRRPGAVLAAGIIAIVVGGINAMAAVAVLAALSALSSAAASSGLSSAASDVRWYAAGTLAGALTLLAVGIGACVGNRSCVRVLRVLVVIGTLRNAFGLVHDVSVFSVLALALDLAMLWLLLSTDTNEWLKNR